MKKELILFYLMSNKIYLYLKKCNKEFIEETDTSLFFNLGDISNVALCEDNISNFISKKLPIELFKPKVVVLYDDITNCDLQYLYKQALMSFNYSEISFVKLSDIVKSILDNDRVVIYDGKYYNIINRKTKLCNLNNLDFEPIIIGVNKSNFTHYSDIDLIWHTFKSHFTN